MAGDQDDVQARITRLLPPWFDASNPILDALITGAAWALAFVYGLYAYAVLQARLATATDAFLDLASTDFFGNLLPRIPNELDGMFGPRIRREVLRDRNTRTAFDAAVYDLTGHHPQIFEAWRGPDCGGYGDPGLAYGRAGRYGSRDAPYEVLITQPRPQGYGIPNRGGWGSGTGGYGVGNFSFADDTQIVGSGPTIADILAAVERVRAAGITVYMQFTDEAYTPFPEAPPADPDDGLEFNFDDPDQALLLGV